MLTVASIAEFLGCLKLVDIRIESLLIYSGLSIIMWQHWIFSFSYFKVAMNFKMIFSINSQELQRQLRLKILIYDIVEYVGLAVIILA